jgi:DNA invertase Pin-like site-specific DNA recombinase
VLNTARPAAYIRRSVARRGDPGDVSREFQTDKVRALAGDDGATLRIIDGDWGRSASTDKTNLRTAFLALMDDIEAGSVSHLYAYSPDRLARSVEWTARLVNACRRAGVPITTTAGTVAPDDPAARAMFHMLAVMNENALDEMERKAKASASTRKDRGELTGGRAYGEVRTLRNGEIRGAGEDAALVLATFHEAGSYFAAARLLNDRKVPARSGGKWYARTVQRIVNRQDPTTVRPGHRRGVRAGPASHRLAGLLRCHCGANMGQTVSGEGTPRYRCAVGAADPSHSRPYIVSERRLLPWVMDEAARFRAPADAAYLADRDDDRLAAIAEERRKLALAFARGGLDDETYQAEDDRLVAEAADIEARGGLRDIPQAIDWDEWSPSAINGALRGLWSVVKLGPDLRPVEATWLVPEWRAD